MTQKTTKATTNQGPLDPSLVTTLDQPLTPKDKKVLAAVAEGASVSKAAEAAGVSKKAAEKTLHRADVRQMFQEALSKHGLDIEALAVKLKEGLDAMDGLVVKGEGVVQIPDFAVRHKYLETALKVIRALTPEEKKGPDPSEQTVININLAGGEAPKQIKAVAGQVIETKPL